MSKLYPNSAAEAQWRGAGMQIDDTYRIEIVAGNLISLSVR